MLVNMVRLNGLCMDNRHRVNNKKFNSKRYIGRGQIQQ